MSIDNKNIDGRLPNLEVHPANELIADPNHSWHAIRGYDFAGLEQILTYGLSPSDNQNDNHVCLSASPTVSHSINREANSFFAYTLKDGLSLSIFTPYVAYPSGNYGGFVDELRRTSVNATEIDGVMLPQHAALQRLVDVSTSHEARKPKQAIAYVERTLQHLSELGVEIDNTTLEMATAAMNFSNTNQQLKKEDSRLLEGAFMKAYAGFLQKDHNISEPTVSDMLAVVLGRVNRSRSITLYAYDKAFEEEFDIANARIAAKAKNGHHLGVVSLSNWY